MRFPPSIAINFYCIWKLRRFWDWKKNLKASKRRSKLVSLTGPRAKQNFFTRDAKKKTTLVDFKCVGSLNFDKFKFQATLEENVDCFSKPLRRFSPTANIQSLFCFPNFSWKRISDEAWTISKADRINLLTSCFDGFIANESISEWWQNKSFK